MKTLFSLLAFCLFYSTVPLFAQQNPDDCADFVRLRDGSSFRGKIIAYSPEGDITFVSWSGVTVNFPAAKVKKIEQRCKGEKRPSKTYDFKEHGIYNLTRFGTLIGQSYNGENTVGFTFSHTVGWMFNRWIGAGIGGGVEIFSPDGLEVSTYPLFASVRGYFLSKNVTPFYAIDCGWAFTGKNAGSQTGYQENWDGGWLTKIQLGYRLGNHFNIYGGLSLQKKTRNWASNWGGEWGQDRILHKRLELGIGVIL